MPSTTAEEKRRLRQETRALLAQLSDPARRASDEALFAAFLALPQLKAAETVFLFHGIPGREPETARLIPPLLALGKGIALPRMTPGHGMDVHRYDPAIPLRPAPFGLLEPDPGLPTLRPEEISLALIPALRYDRAGYRLGFGGGYYDRWLSGYRGVSVGLCREVLLLPALPREDHDRPVDIVLTEADAPAKA